MRFQIFGIPFIICLLVISVYECPPVEDPACEVPLPRSILDAKGGHLLRVFRPCILDFDFLFYLSVKDLEDLLN